MDKKRFVLITGGSGTIGGAIAAALREDHLVYTPGRDLAEVMDTICLSFRPDIFIACAGSRTAPYFNMVGSFGPAEAAISIMSQNHWGRVILFSGGGVGGDLPDVDDPDYCATKAAVAMWAECKGRQMERDGTGVTVNAISPGWVASKMTNFQGDTPDDAVRLVKWLISDEAKHVNGRLLSAKWDRIERLSKQMGVADFRLRRQDLCTSL